MSQYIKKNFFKNCLIILFLFHVINNIYYDLSKQHDVWLHHYYILNILKLKFYEIKSEYGIFYYLYVSFFSILTSPFYFLNILEPRETFYLTIKIANIFLLSITILLFIRLSKKIFKFQEHLHYLPSCILFFYSFFNRTFYMARPENLMICLSVLILIYTYDIFENKKKFFKLIIYSSIIAAQKVSGIIFVIYLIFFLSIFLKNKKIVIKTIIYTGLMLVFYYTFHFFLTDVAFYQNSERLFGEYNDVGILNLKLPLNILYNFSFMDAWLNPLRDSQKLSMFNIIALDYFGDYWGYGINHVKFFQISETCHRVINKTSLVLSCFYLLTIVIATIPIFKKLIQNTYNKKELKTNCKIIIFQTTLFYISFTVLILAALLRYNPGDGDLFKNEYISFFLIYINFILAKNYFSKVNYFKIIIFLIILIICININFIPISCLFTS
jgi:hypothetical protein